MLELKGLFHARMSLHHLYILKFFQACTKSQEPLAPTGYLNLNLIDYNDNEIKLKIQSSVTPGIFHVASGYHIGVHRFEPFPSSQKVLTGQHWSREFLHKGSCGDHILIKNR